MSVAMSDSDDQFDAHSTCASVKDLRDLTKKVDRVIQLLTESTDGKQSVMERIRRQDDDIASIKRQQRQSLLDHCVRQAAGTATSLVVAMVFLLLGKGIIVEVFAKGAH